MNSVCQSKCNKGWHGISNDCWSNEFLAETHIKEFLQGDVFAFDIKIILLFA